MAAEWQWGRLICVIISMVINHPVKCQDLRPPLGPLLQRSTVPLCCSGRNGLVRHGSNTTLSLVIVFIDRRSATDSTLPRYSFHCVCAHLFFFVCVCDYWKENTMHGLWMDHVVKMRNVFILQNYLSLICLMLSSQNWLYIWSLYSQSQPISPLYCKPPVNIASIMCRPQTGYCTFASSNSVRYEVRCL